MSDSLGTVRDTLKPATINSEVAAALDPNFGGKLIAEEELYSPHQYSRLFRAYSAACASLSRGSAPSLIDREAELPVDTNWLGGKLINLLNYSLTRDSDAPYHFASKLQVTSTVCANAEEVFADCLGHTRQEIQAQEKPQVVYVDDDGEPVLFTKGRDVMSTISFSDVAVDGITHPAGTIFRICRQPSTKLTQIGPGLNMAHLDNIGSLQPLRLSLFPIPDDERLETVQPAKAHEMVIEQKQIELSQLPSIFRLDFFLRQYIEEAGADSAPQSASVNPLAASAAYA